MTDTPQRPAVAGPRLPQVFALRDLGVAPENMRFDDAPDDEIPLLAATILAAGLMQPLTVRPGRKKEKPAMALDGRRRLLALGVLRAEGSIDDDYPVEAFVETDRTRQAAAVVLTNSAVPVHVADVIAAIGKMLKAKLEIPAIAAGLGYSEVEVRRLAALAGLSAEALALLKAGRMTLRQAKLLARLADDEVRDQIVQSVTAGFGFPEHRMYEALERGQVTPSDRRFLLVGAARYAAAGGRIESDLFGELPDILLDPGVVDQVWISRARALAEKVGRDDLVIHVTTEPDPVWPEGLEPYGYDDVRLDEAQIAALASAEEAEAASADALSGLDPGDDAADDALVAYILARLVREQAYDPGRSVTQVILNPGRNRPIVVQAFGPTPAAASSDPDATERGGVDDEPGDRADPAEEGRQTPHNAPPQPPPGVTPEGASHALHEVRTDLATRALIRAVADHPETALTALVAQLFSVEVLHQRSREDGALAISAEVYGKPRARSIEALDGEVRRRLAERRAAWRQSGASVIAWVAGLPVGETMDLLAQLVALSLDLSEERTTQVRRRARGEAAELAVLCGADVTAHWTPDATFLRAHSKPQLLQMLSSMGEPEGAAKSLKKEELVGVVAEAAARRRWAPDYLSWRAAEAPADLENEVDGQPAAAEGCGVEPAEPLAA